MPFGFEVSVTVPEDGAQATFFVIGDHVRGYPELTDRLRREGHELGHHMMLDEPSIDLPPEEFLARFEEMDGLLDDLGGSSVFRPASGWYDDRMVEVAAERGYRTVLGCWSFTTARSGAAGRARCCAPSCRSCAPAVTGWYRCRS